MTQQDYNMNPAISGPDLRLGDKVLMRYATKRATAETLTETLAQLNAEDDDEIYWQTHEQMNPGHKREICRGLEVHTTKRYERTHLGGPYLTGGSRA